MNGTRVLVLLPLLVGLAHCFSWDIVVGAGKWLTFYNNGTITHTEVNPSNKDIYAVTYDPIDFRVLFADYHSTKLGISSFDLTTGRIQPMVMRSTNVSYVNLAYDPVERLLFWSEDKEIYSISLKPASTNMSTTIDGNLILTLNDYCIDLEVDSCGGYIYGATTSQVLRAAFDGSGREVLLNIDNECAFLSLVVDIQTEKMFYTAKCSNRQNNIYFDRTELNGKDDTSLYSMSWKYSVSALTVSKDYIYWKSHDQRAILRLPKHKQDGVAPAVYADFSTPSWEFQLIAAYYRIEEQTLGFKTCDALKYLAHSSSAKSSLDVKLQGYGTPCLNYCLIGNCTIDAKGLPNCSCEAGRSGERCEVDVCYMYCLHGGVCSLNEEEEPVCQCTAGYEGERCDVATSTTVVQAECTKQEIGQDLRREIKQVIAAELKRALQIFSDKIDLYEANF